MRPATAEPERPTDVRHRLRDWDVQIPEPLVSYWTAWNEMDLALVSQYLPRAVTEDVAWNDPRNSFVGILKLEVAIRSLRTSKPDDRFVIASEVDHQGIEFYIGLPDDVFAPSST